MITHITIFNERGRDRVVLHTSLPHPIAKSQTLFLELYTKPGEGHIYVKRNFNLIDYRVLKGYGFDNVGKRCTSLSGVDIYKKQVIGEGLIIHFHPEDDTYHVDWENGCHWHEESDLQIVN